MSFFDTISNFFRKPKRELTESEQRDQDGYTAFQYGHDLYTQNEIQAALEYFDTAVNFGFERASLFGMRGGCLQSLGFDLDAIDDFTRAIELDPNDSNNYFMRSISKGAVGDLQGQVDDLEDAIRVAGIDCASSRSLNAFARENGYHEGIAGKYRMDLIHANLLLEEQANDEERLKGPGPHLRLDLASRRRAKARRRTQNE